MSGQFTSLSSGQARVTVKSVMDDGEIDLEAARLSLVALAGMVPSYEPLDVDRVRVAPDVAVLSREKAARLLASMPKPLICHAEIVAGVLEVKCELLAEVSDYEQQRFARLRAMAGEEGDLFKGLVDDEDHLVGAFGRDEPVFVSLASARRWFRDYEISRVTYGIDHVDEENSRQDRDHEEAWRRGARATVRFTSIAGHVSTIDGGSFPFPLPENTSAADRRRVERSFIEMAKQFLFEIEEEEELATVERGLVERGEIPADSIDRYSPGGADFVHTLLSSQMRKFFEGREMPAECVAFIDASRRS